MNAEPGTVRRPPFRAVLDMARAGNLPSVASNVIAALVLSGASGMNWPSSGQLVQALVAGFLLYAGGATLNDVADADFDRKHRPERAIPTGVFSRPVALALGAVEMALGAAMLWRAGACGRARGGGTGGILKASAMRATISTGNAAISFCARCTSPLHTA